MTASKRKNRTFQRLRRRTVYGLARLAQAVLSVLPFDAAVALGGGLGRLAYRILRREREKTIKHLALALGPERQEEELRQIAWRVFDHAGRCAAEVMLCGRWTDARLRERIVSDDTSNLLKALEAGKGAVLLTAHFGNWELLGAYATRILGIDLGVIARRLSNPHLDQAVNRQRERMGLKVFLRGERGARFYRHLIKRGALALLGDQDIRKIEGIFVDFFGRPAHTPTGPAELILRAGAPWFFAVLERQADPRVHRLRIEGPLPVPETGNREARVRRLTEEYARRLEDLVRRCPDQWMWMHDRWKKQPKEQE